MSIRIGAATLAALFLWAAPARADDAVIAFLDSREGAKITSYERIAERPQLALGLASATQGAYSVRQTLLDITAGNRTSRSTYTPDRMPFLAPRHDRDGWYIKGWQAMLERAETAFADIRPGLLATLMGGGAYVGIEPAVEAVVAADRAGNLADVSYGGRRTLVERVVDASREHHLVVTVLPNHRYLDELLATLDDRLLVVLRRPPRTRAPQLLPLGIEGLTTEPALLTSPTTRRRGIVSATDILPTITGSEDAPGVNGRVIEAEPGRDVAALRRMERRLRVVYPRRFPSLNAVLAALALAGLALTLAGRRRQALRVCALAVMWVPFLALVGAALAPSYSGELALMGAGSVVLALITDRFVGWPRGPLVPALLGVGGYLGDLVGSSYLTVRSLLGPNPRFGSRFYGVGNELEATLPVLALVGLAALLWRWPAGRRLAAAFGLAMLGLAGALGAGRLGADVGGVITGGAAGAAAVLVAYGRRPPKWALALGLATPLLALVALAVLDLTTGGDSHFARLLGGDGTDFSDTVQRRYKLAWQALTRGLMPLATVAAIVLSVVAWRRRDAWYAPVRASRAWAAALLGGLAGGVVGTLTNDSGPVLLVLGVVVLGAATVYVRGAPAVVSHTNPYRGEGGTRTGVEAGEKARNPTRQDG